MTTRAFVCACPSRWSTSWKHPDTKAIFILGLSQATSTSENDLEACFSLIEATSKQDYEGSSRGWNPVTKRVEMRDPDLRYILVKDADGHVCAFTSLMPTMEDGLAVVYCYEIHLEAALRGTGLADLLLSFLETVAANIQVMEKVMLTVFTCNTRAVKFYQRLGFSIDELSPQARKLRNGVVKVPDYAIMSKRLRYPELS
ncbi:acyl-CoA N-acyltransferase [Coniella lustricola]|uniref:N-alpha-acetyltransferase 40 n=1 Tax=Coniella lustricola TaxID=2025994 RepID=A0A2T3AAP9_9PEZI|nr:acyl-CoA N-acyltransferase [Coniella lustricola]